MSVCVCASVCMYQCVFLGLCVTHCYCGTRKEENEKKKNCAIAQGSDGRGDGGGGDWILYAFQLAGRRMAQRIKQSRRHCGAINNSTRASVFLYSPPLPSTLSLQNLPPSFFSFRFLLFWLEENTSDGKHKQEPIFISIYLSIYLCCKQKASSLTVASQRREAFGIECGRFHPARGKQAARSSSSQTIDGVTIDKRSQGFSISFFSTNGPNKKIKSRSK